MFTVKAAIDRFFFDKNGVMKVIDNARTRALSKWGAFVRQDARSSLRYRRRPSDPGQPPSAHRTMQRTKVNKKGQTITQGVSPLREFLYFAYDPSTRSVVVGPAKLNSKLGNAPEALEYGGTSTIRSVVYENHKKTWSVRKVTIAARPYMRPAERRTRGTLPTIWANIMR